MPVNIGVNIKKFRKQAGLTLEELGARIDRHLNTVWKWESGDRSPNAVDIKALCEVLNCTESELLSDAAKVQRFELILDPDDNLKMEVVNMTDTAVEQKTMTVSLKRIGLNLNLNTAGMTKKAARELMLATFDEVFNDAWAQQMKWQKRGAEAERCTECS